MNTLTQKWYAIGKTYANKTTGETEAEAFIYDEIGMFGIGAKDFIDEVKSLGKIKTLHLRINSPGGSVIEGNAIFNALKRQKSKIIVYVDGLAASMASIIAMAGDEVVIAENAFFMIHNPSTVSFGESEDLRKDADLMDRMRHNAVKAYAQKTGLPEQEITDMLDAETWIDAEEAVEMGFADRVDDEIEAVASVYHMNALLSKMGKKLPTSQIDINPTSNMATTLTKIELTEKVDALEAEKTTLSERITELEGKVETFDTLQTERDQLSADLDTTKATLSEKETELSEAETKLTEKTEAFDALTSEKSDVDGKLSEAEAEVTRLKALIDGEEFRGPGDSDDVDYKPGKEAREKRIKEFAQEHGIEEYQAVIRLSRIEPNLFKK